MNTANLQLEGLIMAVAAMTEMLIKKGLVSHEEMGQALSLAEASVGQNAADDPSPSNQAAKVFPIRVLSLANQASQAGRHYTFADYAQLIGRMG